VATLAYKQNIIIAVALEGKTQISIAREAKTTRELALALLRNEINA